MHPEVRAALEASIKHWEENVAAKTKAEASIFGDSCPLCQLFTHAWQDEEYEISCCGHPDHGRCPVFARTSEDECGGSPWIHALKAWNNWKDSPTPQWRAAAQAELDFLRSLLPKED